MEREWHDSLMTTHTELAVKPTVSASTNASLHDHDAHAAGTVPFLRTTETITTGVGQAVSAEFVAVMPTARHAADARVSHFRSGSVTPEQTQTQTQTQFM